MKNLILNVIIVVGLIITFFNVTLLATDLMLDQPVIGLISFFFVFAYGCFAADIVKKIFKEYQ